MSAQSVRKVLLLTNEYPPHVYGGAGVHVEFLSRELAKLLNVEVRAFGSQRVDEPALCVRGYENKWRGDSTPAYLQGIFSAMARCVDFAATPVDADIVHCHTWYSHLAGLFIQQVYGVPLVVTVHSLEPLRPWKREQLQGGYELSCWVESTALQAADAVIAVSQGTRDDILRVTEARPERIQVIHNGIDPSLYRRVTTTTALTRYGVGLDRPYVLFVGRVTRQKGIIHLVRAIDSIDPAARVVLCAGSPDTPEIAREMEEAVGRVRSGREGVIWIQEMVPRDDLVQLYSHASVFCCPSIYEPFGIINLEAMACATPVVASAVGGIPEVVVDGETGILVSLTLQGENPFEPVDPPGYSRDLARAINTLLADAALARQMGAAGRARVEAQFGWDVIARQTADLYAGLVAARA